MNILLSGPAGSGKSEFVKCLAKQVRRPLEVIAGSQLLDKWVGGTELFFEASCMIVGQAGGDRP